MSPVMRATVPGTSSATTTIVGCDPERSTAKPSISWTRIRPPPIEHPVTRIRLVAPRDLEQGAVGVRVVSKIHRRGTRSRVRFSAASPRRRAAVRRRAGDRGVRP